jgi:hypothetical protein
LSDPERWVRDEVRKPVEFTLHFQLPGLNFPLPCQANTDMKHDDELFATALHRSSEDHDSEEGDFLMAFGPADHHFESEEDNEEACFYVLGYN